MIRLALVVRVLRERWRGLCGWAFGLVSLVSLQVSVYPTIRDSRKGWSDLTNDFPEPLRKILRMEDYTSPTGYLSMELFSFMFPLIFIGLATTWGARAGAEEDENRTADILFSLPVSRSSILLSRLAAVVVVLVGIGCASVISLAVGTRLIDMKVGLAGLTAASLSCALLSVVFGSVSLAGSCWSGRRGVGLGAGLGLAIACFVTYSLAPLVTFFDRLLPLNPFQWTIGQRPVTDGLDPISNSVALAVSLAFVTVASLVNNRRDVRS
jgi:ABC-2 type transport system permease protein